MASGFECARIANIAFPKTQFAQPSAIDDASTIVTPTPTIDFAPSGTDEYVILGGRLLEDYDGGGTKLRFLFLSSATSGSARWVASWRRMAAGTSPAASFTWSTNEQAVTVATHGSANTWVLVEIPFTHGTQMNNTVAGEEYQIRVHRDQDHADDGLAVDARIGSDTFAILEV